MNCGNRDQNGKIKEGTLGIEQKLATIEIIELKPTTSNRTEIPKRIIKMYNSKPS